jgi:phenylpropionate dioxygenase-like ring-hydroxylating dioxygenase large terminal subunit
VIPWRWYSDVDALAREEHAIFRRAWHYAGHRDRLGRRGDRLAVVLPEAERLVASLQRKPVSRADEAARDTPGARHR